ncbi:hypothetical protein FB451DRAFT_1413935 [Mycena latifolia]|nr:hypothetical protein FB451DRAFT_1413935 [Mycena latifolia]
MSHLTEADVPMLRSPGIASTSLAAGRRAHLKTLTVSALPLPSVPLISFGGPHTSRPRLSRIERPAQRWTSPRAAGRDPQETDIATPAWRPAQRVDARRYLVGQRRHSITTLSPAVCPDTAHISTSMARDASVPAYLHLHLCIARKDRGGTDTDIHPIVLVLSRGGAPSGGLADTSCKGARLTPHALWLHHPSSSSSTLGGLLPQAPDPKPKKGVEEDGRAEEGRPMTPISALSENERREATTPRLPGSCTPTTTPASLQKDARLRRGPRAHPPSPYAKMRECGTGGGERYDYGCAECYPRAMEARRRSEPEDGLPSTYAAEDEVPHRRQQCVAQPSSSPRLPPSDPDERKIVASSMPRGRDPARRGHLDTTRRKAGRTLPYIDCDATLENSCPRPHSSSRQALRRHPAPRDHAVCRKSAYARQRAETQTSTPCVATVDTALRLVLRG